MVTERIRGAWRLRVLVASSLLIYVLGDAASAVSVQIPALPSKQSKLHFRLVNLLGLPAPPAPRTEGPVRIDHSGRVQVYILVTSVTEGILDRVVTLGGKIDGQGNGIVQAWVPINALASLVALPEVKYIRPPDYPKANANSRLGKGIVSLGQPKIVQVPPLVTTEGDTVLGFAAARQQFNVSGQGVRVGVLSAGVFGLEESIASGDLPATAFHCLSDSQAITQRSDGCLPGETLVETSGAITGQSFRSAKNLAPPGSDFAEGTAMLEIINDLAPGAELWFANFETTLEFADATAFLAANVDVMVSDIVVHGYFPNGQNSVTQTISQIIGNPSNRARGYIQAIGNYADAHYSDSYRRSNVSGPDGTAHLFQTNSQTSGPASPAPFNVINVGPLASMGVFLSWNDPAGASANDYDLLLFNCLSGDLLDWSDEIQEGFQEPQEAVFFANSSASPVDVCYAIVNAFDQAAPRILNVTISGDALHGFNTAASSLIPPADASGNLIAVGAVPASSPGQIEPFSSRGPIFDGENKPDVVATDGVTVSGAGEFPSPFFGTSAAAPHVAALAALVLECRNSLTAQSLKIILKSSAVALEAPDNSPNISGSGRIDALAAVQQTCASSSPIVLVTPSLQNFGNIAVGSSADKDFVIQNIGGGTLSGSATTLAPYSVIAGGTYDLGPDQSQVITVRFSPTSTGSFNGTISFSGAGGTSASLLGSGFVPSVLKFKSATYKISEKARLATVTVTRTGEKTGTVEIAYETSDGTATAGEDYTSSTGILTFGPGVTSRKFTIPMVNDTLDEPNETVNLTLKEPSAGAVLGSPGTAVLTITDNDVAGKVQFSSASYKVDEAGGSVVITVKRTGGSASGVSIDYETGGGTATAGE
ncbi:MAG: S8 family serine peptidase, partial [Deltaproteobacteria bacterium]|nr:S8 family serine peptidase [Deltaproteobacteria bacterium]